MGTLVSSLAFDSQRCVGNSGACSRWSRLPAVPRRWPREAAHRCGASIRRSDPPYLATDVLFISAVFGCSNSRGQMFCATNRSRLTGSLFPALVVSDVHLVAGWPWLARPTDLASPPSDLRNIVRRPPTHLPPSILPRPPRATLDMLLPRP